MQTDGMIKDITTKYLMKVHYLDLSNENSFINSINKFLCLTYLKKGLYQTRKKTIKKKESNVERRSMVDLTNP